MAAIAPMASVGGAQAPASAGMACGSGGGGGSRRQSARLATTVAVARVPALKQGRERFSSGASMPLA